MNDFSIRGVLGLHTQDFKRGINESLGDLRRLRTGMAQTAATARLLEYQERRVNDALRDQRRELAALTLEFTAFRNAMRTTALRGAVAGFGALTAAALGAGNALSNVAEQAGLAAAALGAGATSNVMAFVQALVVGHLALDDIGKALTTTGTDHEKAMEKLTKPAREFVGELRGIQMGMREVRLLAQQGLFPGVVRGLKDMEGLAGPVKQTVYDTAQVLGYLTEEAGELAKSPGFARDIQAIGKRNALTLQKMGVGTLSMVDALRTALIEGDPLIAHITSGWQRLSENINESIKDAQQDGSLANFFDEAREAYDRLTSTVGSGGKVVFNVLRASHPVAERQAEAMKRVAKHAADWTGTKDGQRQILEYFERMEPVTTELGKSLGATIASIGRMGADGAENSERILRGYREDILPLVERLGMSLNEGVLPAIIDITRESVEFLDNSAPALHQLGEVAAFIAESVAGVVGGINELTGRIGGVGGGFASLAIGALALKSWRSLSDLIARSVLMLRQFVGLAPRVAAGPALTGSGTAAGVAPMVGVGFGGAGRRGNPYHGRAPWRPGHGATSDLMLPWLGGHVSSGERIGRSAGRGPDPRRILAGLSGQLQREYALAFRREVERVSRTSAAEGRARANVRSAAASVGAVIPGPGPSAARQRYEQALRPTAAPLTRGERAGLAVGNLAAMTRDGLVAGARRAQAPMAGLLKGTVATAAISGLITAASDPTSKEGFAEFARNLASGVTFGGIESTTHQRDRLATIAMRSLRGGSVLNGPGADLWAAAGKPGGQAPNLRTSTGVAEFRGVWLRALRDGKKITDDQFRQIDAAARKLQTQLTGKERVKNLLGINLDASEVTGFTDNVTAAFARLRKDVPADLTDARNRVTNIMAAIKASMQEGSLGAKLVTSKAFDDSARAIRRSMKAGLINVEQGTREIQKLMIAKFKLFGLSDKEARFRAAGKEFSGKSSPGGTTHTNAARGGPIPVIRKGLQTIGQKGAAGRDNIPISAVVGAGEDVAVFNRHQRRYIDERLADVGGLPGVFRGIRQEHSKPYAGKFARGGMVTGDTDYRPEMGAALNAMARATRRSIFVQSGGRTMGEQAALVKAKGLYGPGNPTGAAAPSESAPHVRGIAADITPGRDVFGGVAGRFNLGFPLAKEPWHIELLKELAAAVGARGASKSGGARAKTGSLPRLVGDMAGLFGGIQQGAIDQIRDAANAYLQEQSGGSTSEGGGGKAAAPAQVKAWLTEALQITGHYSAANLSALIGRAMQESGGNPRAINLWDSNAKAGTPSKGLLQTIDSTFNAHKLPGMDDIWDPVHNAVAAIRYMFSRYGRIVAANGQGYEVGGFMRMATAPTLGGPLPAVNTADAITPGSRGGRKKGKNRVVNAVGAPPNLTPVTVGRSKAKLGKIKPPKISRRVRELIGKLKTGKLADVKELVQALALEQSIETKDNLAAAMEGKFGLTDEYPTVILEDTEDHRDLTNYLLANPAALRGAKNPADFMARYGDSLEVINWDGMVVQGRPMRGINQRVNEEIDPLLGVRRAILGLADGPGGTRELRAAAAGKLAAGIKERTDRVVAINRYLTGPKGKTGSIGLRKDVEKSIRAEQRKGMTWQQAVRENERRIELIEDNNADLSNAPEGVSYGNLGGADGIRRRNQKLIDALRDEIAFLKSKKPKGGSARRKRTLYDQLRHINHEHETLTGEDSGRGDGGFRGRLRDQLGEWKASSDDNAGALRQLTEVAIPAFGLDVDRLLKERGELTGTTIPSPKLSGGGADEGALNALLKEENDRLRKANLLAEVQFNTLSGFGGLASGRLLGSFMTGGVTEGPGLALVHANERLTVEPDPEGPFGNRAAARGAGGAMNVELTVKLDDAGLLRIVDARVQGKSAAVTSRKLGREARIIAAAPGRR